MVRYYAYAIIRPRVYTTPAMITALGCITRLDKNDIAAMLVARGHGLIDVSTPSHKADNIAIIYFFLIILLESL